MWYFLVVLILLFLSVICCFATRKRLHQGLFLLPPLLLMIHHRFDHRYFVKFSIFWFCKFQLIHLCMNLLSYQQHLAQKKQINYLTEMELLLKMAKQGSYISWEDSYILVALEGKSNITYYASDVNGKPFDYMDDLLVGKLVNHLVYLFNSGAHLSFVWVCPPIVF